MPAFIRICVLAITAGLLGGCGGTGGGAAENPPGVGAAPPAVAGAWDSWNWDEGAFSE